MLSELKPIIKVEEKKENSSANEVYYLAEREFSTLSIGKYEYKGKIVEVKGIEEDFRVYFDNQLVCEVVYDSVYNLNVELAKELLF